MKNDTLLQFFQATYHTDKGCHGKQSFEQVNDIKLRQSMCEAGGKGKFRLPREE